MVPQYELRAASCVLKQSANGEIIGIVPDVELPWENWLPICVCSADSDIEDAVRTPPSMEDESEKRLMAFVC